MPPSARGRHRLPAPGSVTSVPHAAPSTRSEKQNPRLPSAPLPLRPLGARFSRGCRNPTSKPLSRSPRDPVHAPECGVQATSTRLPPPRAGFSPSLPKRPCSAETRPLALSPRSPHGPWPPPLLGLAARAQPDPLTASSAILTPVTQANQPPVPSPLPNLRLTRTAVPQVSAQTPMDIAKCHVRLSTLPPTLRLLGPQAGDTGVLCHPTPPGQHVTEL